MAPSLGQMPASEPGGVDSVYAGSKAIRAFLISTGWHLPQGWHLPRGWALPAIGPLKVSSTDREIAACSNLHNTHDTHG